MNAMHLHLLLNHVPVLGTIFGLALLVPALLRRRDELKRVVLGCLIVTAFLDRSRRARGLARGQRPKSQAL